MAYDKASFIIHLPNLTNEERQGRSLTTELFKAKLKAVLGNTLLEVNSLLYSNITQEFRKILANHFTNQMYIFIIILLICIFPQC